MYRNFKQQPQCYSEAYSQSDLGKGHDKVKVKFLNNIVMYWSQWILCTCTNQIHFQTKSHGKYLWSCTDNVSITSTFTLPTPWISQNLSFSQIRNSKYLEIQQCTDLELTEYPVICSTCSKPLSEQLSQNINSMCCLFMSENKINEILHHLLTILHTPRYN